MNKETLSKLFHTMGDAVERGLFDDFTCDQLEELGYILTQAHENFLVSYDKAAGIAEMPVSRLTQKVCRSRIRPVKVHKSYLRLRDVYDIRDKKV